MGNRRVLILVGVLIVAIALIGVAFVIRGMRTPEPAPEDLTPIIPTVKVVVASNNLDRGTLISEGMVEAVDWPEDRLPHYYQPGTSYQNVEDVIGLRVRTFIPQGMPLTYSLLTTGPLEAAETGSEEALGIPPGSRALAIPVDFLSGVAWIIKPGDHVDVIASWYFYDLDDEFQSLLPNEYECVGPFEEGEVPCGGVYGRMEILPTGQTVMVLPSTESFGMYAAQMTIQNAQILQIGSYIPKEPVEPTAEEVAAAEEAAAAEGPPPEEPPPPTPTPIPSTQAVVLVMKAQDAIVLKALMEMQAEIDLVLRGVNDEEEALTEPVTMEYIVTHYGLQPPPRLPYVGVPPLPELLRSIIEGTPAEGAEATE